MPKHLAYSRDNKTKWNKTIQDHTATTMAITTETPTPTTINHHKTMVDLIQETTTWITAITISNKWASNSSTATQTTTPTTKTAHKDTTVNDLPTATTKWELAAAIQTQTTTDATKLKSTHRVASDQDKFSISGKNFTVFFCLLKFIKSTFCCCY